MIHSEKINNFEIFFSDEYSNTLLGPYYDYILQEIKKILKNYESEKKISLGVNGQNTDINIDFQIEHTIHYNKETGEITLMLQNYKKLIDADIILEYSMTNVKNLKSTIEGRKFIEKVIYCPPIIYDNIEIEKNRNKEVMVLQNFSPRRAELYQKYNVDCVYITDKNQLLESYWTYKILMNTHQIDEHLTVEELRILPALMNGVIIVSEKGPFYENIPYQKHIIWSDYDNIIDETKKTIENYDIIRKKKLKFLNRTIKKIKNNFEKEFRKKLEKLL